VPSESPVTERPSQVCRRCVMDTSDPDIIFDADGICNRCSMHLAQMKRGLPSREEADRLLRTFVDRARQMGQGKPYDVVIGLSGGVDSSWVAVLVKSLGLRPIAVHLDNGWNTPEAVQNIECILRALKIDLVTEVVDWELFRDMHLSFLRASTPDAEIPTDHAIGAVLMDTAVRFGVKFIVNGSNLQTEGLLPPAWSRGYHDWKYIRSVFRTFAKREPVGFPHYDLAKHLYLKRVVRLTRVDILNWTDFDKEDAKRRLVSEYGWTDYGGKHHESIFTRFFQSVVLPRKFGFDKRRAHLTNLILAGRITREQALEELTQPPCSADLERRDRRFVLKKLGISDSEFDAIMATPPRTIFDYPSYERNLLYRFARRFYAALPTR
jgi:N-acetyl sugar amidotransferase